jgi:putative methionine-R-sulfoxide reductase with GAF domain
VAKRDQLQDHLEGLFSDLSAETPQVEEETARQPAADDLLRLFGATPEAPPPAPEPATGQMSEPEPGLASVAPVLGSDTLASAALPGAQRESAARVATPRRRRLRPSTAQQMFLAVLFVALVPLLVTLVFGNTPFVILVALAIAGILAVQFIQVFGWARARTATGTQSPTEAATDTPEAQRAPEEAITAIESRTETATLERTIAQLQQQATDWAAGAEITRAVASSLDPQQVLQVAADTIQSRFHLHNVSLYLVDQSGAALAAVASSGEAALEITSGPQRWAIKDDNLVAVAYNDGQACLSNDTPRGSQSLPPASQSQLALPLRAGGKRLGVMEIHSTEADAFSDQKALTYAQLADVVAVALLNAQRYTEKKQLANSRELAAALTDRMARETELEEVVTVTLRQLGKTYKLEQATLCLGIGAELTAAGNGHRTEAP